MNGSFDMPTGARPRQLAASNLMYQFESLGHDCEFGKVQTYWGATPPGLLRWARTWAEGLIKAVDTRFDAIVDPNYLDFEISPSGEFHALNRKYHFRMHTFIQRDAVSQRELYIRFKRSIDLLTRKFQEELDGSLKIYIFKSRIDNPAAVRRISRALRRHGPNTLLWVTPARSGQVPGSVEILGDGLFKGYVDRMNVRDPSYDMWLTVCQNAYDLWTNQTAGMAVRP